MILAHTLSPEVRNALGSSEGFQASPTFVLCAPRRRGRFGDRRLARSRRSDGYRARVNVRTPDFGACLQAVTNAWCAFTRQ